MSKTVYIMRGIPGSGKSTVARQIASSYPGSFSDTDPDLGKWVPDYAIHSTDDLCMVDGEYQFDIELAPARHAQNYLNFLGSLDKQVPCVIVDNTNVKVSQYTPYVDAAHDAAYTVVFVELHHPALMVAVERTTHGVSEEIINQMILDWEPSQHNAIVEDVILAAKTVRVVQAREKVAVWVGVALGSLAGSCIVGLAWALWPSCWPS